MGSPTPPLPQCPNQKIPLLALLVVPFVLQITTAVGLAGYFCYRNEQQMIESLAGQASVEVGSRAEQTLAQALQAPADITQNNEALLRLGILSSRDRGALKAVFEEQLKRSDSVDTVAIVDERKTLLSVEKQHGGTIAVQVQAQVSGDVLNRYLAGSLAQSPKPSTGSSTNRREPLTTDDWYLAAKSTGKPLWRLAEKLTAAGQPILTVVNVQPRYDRANRFQGALAASVSLSALSNALQQSKIAKTGQAFIVDQQGYLVANSTGDRLFQQHVVKREHSEALSASARSIVST